ncbi:zinc finger protein 595 [Cyclospora cayetanensis]|uniref:Zinc finger protein 595 n=1 Tax=Cyclospora cayetanensis TaxID=88456 RepID=A0A6P6RUL6_9EIME|nr:zinc finger protein 595 [Cyclospora cayetanensis]
MASQGSARDSTPVSFPFSPSAPTFLYATNGRGPSEPEKSTEVGNCSSSSRIVRSKRSSDNSTTNRDNTEIYSEMGAEAVRDVCSSELKKRKEATPLLCTAESCNLAFRKKTSLERHILCHSDQRSFKCEDCGAAFKRKEHLSRHKVLRHKTRSPPSMNTSGASTECTDPNGELRKPEAPQNFECEHCGKAFLLNYHLKRHLKTHMLLYKCRGVLCAVKAHVSSLGSKAANKLVQVIPVLSVCCFRTVYVEFRPQEAVEEAYAAAFGCPGADRHLWQSRAHADRQSDTEAKTSVVASWAHAERGKGTHEETKCDVEEGREFPSGKDATNEETKLSTPLFLGRADHQPYAESNKSLPPSPGQPTAPFSCPHRDCGKVFTSLDTLYRHLRRAAQRKRDYACPVCDATFLVFSALVAHKRSAHSSKLHSCEQCGKVSASKCIRMFEFYAHRGYASRSANSYVDTIWCMDSSGNKAVKEGKKSEVATKICNVFFASLRRLCVIAINAIQAYTRAERLKAHIKVCVVTFILSLSSVICFLCARNW